MGNIWFDIFSNRSYSIFWSFIHAEHIAILAGERGWNASLDRGNAALNGYKTFLLYGIHFALSGYTSK